MDGSGKLPNRGLFRSRKRVFSICLLILAVLFAIIMLGGQNQQRLYKMQGISAGYQPDRGPASDRAPAKISGIPRHSDEDYAKVTSSHLRRVYDILESIPVLPVESANGVESERAHLLQDDAERAAPIGGAFHSKTDQALATDITDNERTLTLETRQAFQTHDAFHTATKQANHRKGVESKVPLHIEGAVHDLKIMPADKDDLSTPLSRRDDSASQTTTTENFISARTTTETVYYDICEKCCYRYTTIDHDITQVLNASQLQERGCTQRLPDAMIFGVKKGGTTTLKNFLSYHPDIAFTQKEMKFFTSYSERRKGMEYYRGRMIYSTPDQITMEKTPAYSHYPKVPALIKKTLPNVKLIIIMRDPIERAISDFVHMQVTIARKCFKVKPYTGSAMLSNISFSSLDECDFSTRYVIENTFEKSVINSRGNVNSSSQLIAKGIYVKDVERYLEYFGPENVLAIDGEAFIHDPYPAVKQVEQFLGIRDYFTPEHFYFDSKKGFFCLNKPIPNNCMTQAKGRPHPVVQEETLQKLRDFYRPYNKALKKLVNLDLQWSS